MAAPKLRFKEFDADWISNKIIDLADYVDYRGKTPKKVESGILLVTAKNIKQGYLDYSASQEFIEESAFDDVMRRGKVELNDVLITTEAPLGNVASVDRTDIALAQRVIKYRGKTGLLDNLFLKQKFLSESFQEILKSKATGGTVQGIKGSVLHQTPLIVPSKEEQTKIATFLSAVDEKISQLSQKLHLLGQYKQGMMQKLFSQQIRFKADDGSEFGEWDEYSLDTLLSKIIDNRGKTPVTEANLEIPLIEVNAIGQRRIKYEKVSKYFSEDTFQNWFRAYLEHQDILFSTVGNTAICSIYTDEIKAGIAQNIVGLRANIKLIQPTFLYYLLTEISNNQKFKSIEMQAVQPSIKVSQMIHLTFLTPCLEEQSKIANFLSSIDQKIEVVAQQIEQAKLWKKGLLQQMFV